MSDVASLDNCRRLYDLSDGWNDTDFWWHELKDGWSVGHPFSPGASDIPAYDLGYLIRKLPRGEIRNRDGKFTAWQNNPENIPVIEADTPEDCVTLLAIALIEGGVVQPDKGVV